MLVLSRKLKEKIAIPTLGVTLQVLEVKGKTVRLGIEAPPEIHILRGELPDRAAEWDREESLPEQPAAPAAEKSLRPAYTLRDRLESTGVGLGLARLQLDLGRADDARATLAELQQEFQVTLQAVREGEKVSPPSPPSRVGKRQKALLVEDDSSQRALLAGFLRHSGLDVDTAGDGSDALDYLRSHARPDVVLLDMGLPRMDGPTMVRELRRNPAYAGLKIFGVTGHQPEEFDLEQGPAGVNRWFHKPFDPNELLQDLSEELNNSFENV